MKRFDYLSGSQQKCILSIADTAEVTFSLLYQQIILIIFKKGIYMKNNIGNDLKIPPIGRKPLNVKVYETLKKSIISGTCQPNTKLSESELAKQMNVSPTPVREAFRRLAAEGLVKIIPWKGAVVSSYSLADIKDTYQCREALEVYMTRLAVPNIDKKGISKLRMLLEQSKEAKNETELVEINSRIHTTITDYANNSKMKSLLDSLRDVIIHDRNLSAYSSDRRIKIYEEHVELINAIEEKNIPKAEETMRKHIINGYQYIVEKIKFSNNLNRN